MSQFVEEDRHLRCACVSAVRAGSKLARTRQAIKTALVVLAKHGSGTDEERAVGVEDDDGAVFECLGGIGVLQQHFP